MGQKPAIFLDRDGVLNRSLVRGGKPYAPRHASEFRLLPGSRISVEYLKGCGLLVVVVTNQPDIGNGLVAPEEVAAMNLRLRDRVPVDDVLVCPHSQGEGCSCRKPKPGMLLEASRRYDIDLGKSFMVGDRGGDIAAGRAAGCTTIFINRRYAEPLTETPDYVARNLPDAVRIILSLIK